MFIPIKELAIKGAVILRILFLTKMAVVEGRRHISGMQAASQEVVQVNWSDELDSTCHRVLVVVDPAKDLSAIITMEWTLDHVVQQGDNLKLLAILQQNSNPSSKGGFQAGLSKRKKCCIHILLHSHSYLV